MILVLLCVIHVVAVVSAGEISFSPEQTCTLEKFQLCLTSLQSVTQNQDLVFATTTEELATECGRLIRSVKCFDSHKERCFTHTQQKVFNHVLAGARQFIEELCVSGGVQQEYLLHAKCFKNISMDEEKCGPTYRHTLYLSENVKQEGNVEEELRKTCCAFSEFVHCKYVHVSNDCGPEAGRFLRRHMERISGPLIHEHCAAYTHRSEACVSKSSKRHNFGITTSISVIFVYLILMELT
ncbi:uncharacterized protein LOC106467534 isoform X1 [Limulus polyphemus]|uniref:Uncharacterized protein LOC106467534 isoform X1 n=1 Tax=Limulus polyphemus TaxID=6850 RepID=A0ABM1T6D2_LIMPO|nr:uncharacterized protein LOC106467534 isoform X1 [Limulus polyphemus]